MISVPVDVVGGVESHLVEWMLALDMGAITIGDWRIIGSICRDRPVVSSRNRLVKRFLETDCDVLLTVDSDQIPFLGKGDKTGGLELLLDAIERPEVDIVNAITLRITDKGPAPVINKLTGPTSCELYTEILEQPRDLYELKEGAMGGAGLMVKRHVLEHFLKEEVMWFKDVFVEKRGQMYDEKSKKDLFGERVIGHDVWFFQRCHEFGFRSWVDTRVFWGHVKPSDLRAEFRREMQFLADKKAAEDELAKLKEEVDGAARLHVHAS